MVVKSKKKFIAILVIIVGIITVLIGEYLTATAYEFKRNCKSYVADIIHVSRYSSSKLDPRRMVSVVYKVGTFNYCGSFEYYTFNLPKENQIIVYNNPTRLFSEGKTDWDLSKNLIWIISGLIVIVIGGYLYIDDKNKKLIKKNKENKEE